MLAIVMRANARFSSPLQSSTPKMLRFKDYDDYADELHSGHYRDGALRVCTLCSLYGEPYRRGQSPWKMLQNEPASSWHSC
jgi:hypothetical protein